MGDIRASPAPPARSRPRCRQHGLEDVPGGSHVPQPVRQILSPHPGEGLGPGHPPHLLPGGAALDHGGYEQGAHVDASAATSSCRLCSQLRVAANAGATAPLMAGGAAMALAALAIRMVPRPRSRIPGSTARTASMGAQVFRMAARATSAASTWLGGVWGASEVAPR